MLLLSSFLLFSCVLFITLSSSSWRHPFSHKKCIFHVILCTFHRILFNKKKIVVYFVLVNDLNNTKKYMYEVDPLGILKTWMFKTVSLLSFFNFYFSSVKKTAKEETFSSVIFASITTRLYQNGCTNFRELACSAGLFYKIKN